MKKPIIFITNDDGVYAPGIITLADAMSMLGEVVVVAPDKHQSGKSNAITCEEPIRYTLLQQTNGKTVYSCTGTPTDCVKIGINQILDRKPDLLVSGINAGSNATINVIYSGTMGAAMEGCANGIPSIGFSLCISSKDYDFFEATEYATKIAQQVLQNGLPHRTCLNVNIPEKAIKGVRFCQQTDGFWTEEFQKGTDPRGRNYFWLCGEYTNREPNNENSDEWALANGYISIVPCRIDLTDYDFLKNYKKYNYEF